MPNLEHPDLQGSQLHVPWYFQDTDPGAVGAWKAWIDTNESPLRVRVRNAANDGWLLLGELGASNFSGARVYHDADTTLTTGVAAIQAFNSERYDTEGYHSPSVNNTRLTIPATGYYTVSACVRFAANATGQRSIYFTVNGTTGIAMNRCQAAPGAGVQTGISLSTDYFFNAGDYIELNARQDSGGDLALVALGNYSPEFMIHRIGLSG